LRELGTKFGISRQTASLILQRQGVALRRYDLFPEQVDAAVWLDESG
jgi:hypothetical protein